MFYLSRVLTTQDDIIDRGRVPRFNRTQCVQLAYLSNKIFVLYSSCFIYVICIYLRILVS